MRNLHTLVPALICGVAAAQLPAPQNQMPARDLWQVTLCATTSIGVCGNPCEPFTCEPHFTMASAGERVRFDIGGTANEPFFLLLGSAVQGCQPIAGIDGALALWVPILTVDAGIIEYHKTLDMLCMSGYATRTVDIPATLPPGTDLRFQVLANNTYEVFVKRPRLVDPNLDPMAGSTVVKVRNLALSRPVDLRIR